MIIGYSDRINHAFAFAAKHHDQQVRKGTRAPYFTQAANVAVILTRYDQDEDTIVAGILQSAVADYVREGYTAEMLEQRIGDKFGFNVLDTTLKVVERRYDDDGIELSTDERKDDLITRIAHADDRARWVLAADALHTGGTLLADLRRTEFPETVWSRFSAGRDGTVRWYRRLHDRLVDVGFTPAIVQELRTVTEALEQLRAEPARR